MQSSVNYRPAMRSGGEVIAVHEVVAIGVRNYRLIPPGDSCVTLPTWGRNVASGGWITFSMVDYEEILGDSLEAIRLTSEDVCSTHNAVEAHGSRPPRLMLNRTIFLFCDGPKDNPIALVNSGRK